MSKQAQTGTSIESLIDALASRDGLRRQKARQALIAVGRPAVPFLIRALQDSRVDQVRWEAAKALAVMSDARAIPTLVRALEDKDADVAWLAAEALQRLGKAAWPALLRVLIQRGGRSAVVRQGVHHVFRSQWEEEFEDLIEALLRALESETVPEMEITAAHAILERMNMREEEDDIREPRRRKPAEGTR